MTVRDVATLKGYFNNGDVPSEANFADLIDSSVGIVNGMLGGAAISTQQLIQWAQGEAYEILTQNPDDDGVTIDMSVKWPDGSAGVFTTTLKNAPWLQIDAYTVTHVASGKTITQAAVTRNLIGVITVKPALTVA